jgi:lysophospholipase L1-like esterase
VTDAYAAALAPVPDGPKILPLGDSITFGVGSSTRSGYRTDLLERLAAVGVDADFVGSQSNGVGADLDHEGHPGWRIDQVREHVDGWLAQAQPDVVLLDVGTNDYVQSYDQEMAPARLSDLIDRILASSPTVRVVVAKLLLPLGQKRARGVAAFNATIPVVVAGKGPRVAIADMSRISRRNTTDGLHPNDLGYRQMAYQWFQSIRTILGGAGWAPTPDPFPAPSVLLARSAAVVKRGRAVTLTARLSGPLTAVDLGRVPVQLLYRPLGSSHWTVLRTARTTSTGVTTFRQPLNHAGQFAAQIGGGQAAGRRSGAVRVDTT